MLPLPLTTLANWLQVPIGNGNGVIQRLHTDSRTVQKGDLFVAIKGEQVDGHRFIEEAGRRGAVAALVADSYVLDSHMPLIRVEDPIAAMQSIAKRLVESFRGRIIAVTGSYGKTTTKQFIVQLLSGRFKLLSSQANFNSQVGLPLTLINNYKGDESFFVLEMAMDSPGQISRLIQIAPPDLAVITNCALVHAQFFSTLDEIIQAKSEVLTHPKTKKGFVPFEIALRVQSIGSCQKVTFSDQHPQADCFLKGNQIKLRDQTELFPRIPKIGPQHHLNVLIAIAVAKEVGMDWTEIKAALSQLTLPPKRFELLVKGGVIFIDDTYNACEPSVCGALSALPVPKKGGRRIALLADMKELGKFSQECHQRVSQHALNCVDLLICMGKEYQVAQALWEGRPFYWSMDRDEIVDCLKREIEEGDVVLVKGSCSWKLWEIVEEITK